LEKPSSRTNPSFWRSQNLRIGLSFSPATWLKRQALSSDFWTFFTGALFYDLGFLLYFFLFNLYLLDLHFDERAIGLISGALPLGSLAGFLPAGLLARRFGLRPLLIVCFLAAPALNALRTFAQTQTTQMVLAFVTGLVMCLWGVCFAPAIARLTTPDNRATAFSLILSASVAVSILGGPICGYVPQWLPMDAAHSKRLILLAACAIAALGVVPILRLRLPESTPDPIPAPNRRWKPSPFLLRFLPAMALWTAVLTAFTPFANVYLARQLHIPMSRIGLVFSISQGIQLGAGLMTPLLFRKFGLINGVVATQLLTAVAIGALALAHNPTLAIGLYLAFSATQWMAGPGLYNLLMDKVPDAGRSTASALMMFLNALVGSGSTALAGLLFTSVGYPLVLAGIAAIAIAAAVLFRKVVATHS
jgi:MFS family permease